MGETTASRWVTLISVVWSSIFRPLPRRNQSCSRYQQDGGCIVFVQRCCFVTRLFYKLTVVSHQNSEHAFLQTAASSLPWFSVLEAAASTSPAPERPPCLQPPLSPVRAAPQDSAACGVQLGHGLLFPSHFATLAH